MDNANFNIHNVNIISWDSYHYKLRNVFILIFLQFLTHQNAFHDEYVDLTQLLLLYWACLKYHD